jgi:hypothetical protein
MNPLENVASARVSRRTLIKGAGALGVGITLSQARLFREVAAQQETIQDILNITATTEAFGVTLLGTVIENIRQGNFSRPVPANVQAVLVAARAQEQFHLEFFQSIGGQLLTNTFTIPDPRLVTDYDFFFTNLAAQEAREVAAQIAAFNTFVAEGRSDLVKVSYQYAAEEAEHRLLANFAAGVRPANNVAFAPALFTSVTEFLAALQQLGIIGGSGTPATYPGPGAIDASNVTERTPGGQAVMCMAPAGAAQPTAPAATATRTPVVTPATPARTPVPTTPSPTRPAATPTPPMPGLPNTGGGSAGGAGTQETLQTLGLLGLGAAAAGALARRLKAQSPATEESGGQQE